MATLRLKNRRRCATPDGPAWVRDTLAQTLVEHRKEALLYRTLATLRTDAPVDTSLAALKHQGVPREPFELFARQVDSPGLLLRVTRWAA